MGKIKHTFVKRSAKRLYELNPDEFSKDFDVNKKAINSKNIVESKSIRNKMAGYMIHLVKAKKF